MKIISQFQDYYDFYSNVYGVDHKIVFNRRKKLKSCFFSKKRLFFPFVYRFICFHYLIVCGKCYFIKRGTNFPFSKDTVISFEESKPFFFSFINSIYPDAIFEKESQELIEISKEIKSPLFKVTDMSWDKSKHLYCYHVDSQIPSLQELGFSKFQSPEEVYQNVSYFLANILNPSPDLSPPVSISDDRVKIIEHGFDLKTSFRHVKKM